MLSKLNKATVFTIFTAVFGAGVGAGYYLFYKTGPVAYNTVTKYVSQEEILMLEKDRIDKIQDDSKNKNLFFGKGQIAAQMIADLASQRGGNRVKVLYTNGPIKGRNVSSISKEIYDELIEKLALDIEHK